METLIINNPYHAKVIRNMATHESLRDRDSIYLVDRIRQMFPEYRDESLRPALIDLVIALRDQL